MVSADDNHSAPTSEMGLNHPATTFAVMDHHVAVTDRADFAFGVYSCSTPWGVVILVSWPLGPVWNSVPLLAL